MGLVPQDGIAHVVIVRHLHVVKEDHVFQLRGIAHHTVVPHQGAAPDEGTGTDLGLMADDAGPGDVVVGIDHGVLGDPHVLLGMVVLLGAQRGAQLQDEALDTIQDLVRIGLSFKQGRGFGMGEIQQISDGIHIFAPLT